MTNKKVFKLKEIQIEGLDGSKQPLNVDKGDFSNQIYLAAENISHVEFARKLYNSEDGEVDVTEDEIKSIKQLIETKIPYIFVAKLAIGGYLDSLLG